MSNLLKRGIVSSMPFEVNCRCSKENAIDEIGRAEFMKLMEDTVGFMEDYCRTNDFHPIPMIITAVVANLTKASFSVLDDKAREMIEKKSKLSGIAKEEVDNLSEKISELSEVITGETVGEASNETLGAFDWKDAKPIKTGISKKKPAKKKPAKKKEE